MLLSQRSSLQPRQFQQRKPHPPLRVQVTLSVMQYQIQQKPYAGVAAEVDIVAVDSVVVVSIVAASVPHVFTTAPVIGGFMRLLFITEHQFTMAAVALSAPHVGFGQPMVKFIVQHAAFAATKFQS
jgi:hypothetical protein